MAHLLQAAGLIAVTLGTGAATVSVMNEDIPDLAVPDAAWAAGSELDGMVFYTTDTITETGEVLTDEVLFRDGRFQSAKCQEYCDFGWSEYRTWTEGDVVHFTTTAVCPDAPHTVVWHGTVRGDSFTAEASWTTRRWYWTYQINALSEGTTTPPPGDDVAG